MTSPASDIPGTVVIYDLDGVITRHDSFTALVLARLWHDPLRLLRALSAVALLVSPRRGRRYRAGARVTAIALAGLREGDYATIAASFGERLGSDPAWIRPEAVERVRRQRAQGARIVIATASERRLAQALLARAGVAYDLLSASSLTQTPTGMEAADHRVGARKAEALREQGIAIDEAEFVTDSLTDLPTARAAATVTLLGASRRTRVRYARAGIRTTALAG